LLTKNINNTSNKIDEKILATLPKILKKSWQHYRKMLTEKIPKNVNGKNRAPHALGLLRPLPAHVFLFYTPLPLDFFSFLHFLSSFLQKCMVGKNICKTIHLALWVTAAGTPRTVL
jgi:hypothetical protein